MKFERKNLKMGRPKDITSPIVNKDNPDNYPTLVRYMEATGRLKHVTSAKMLKARHLYLRCTSVEAIAHELNIEPAIVDRWALVFSWDDERDRRLYAQFRKLNTTGAFGGDLAKRHERIAGTIEQVAERLLEQQANGKIKLSAKDLSTLATTLKSTQEIRKTARGQNVDRKENNVNINVNVPGNFDKIAGALVDMVDRPRLIKVETKSIALGAEGDIGRDTQFEEAVNWDSDESEKPNGEN